MNSGEIIGRVETPWGVANVYTTRYPAGGAIAVHLASDRGEPLGVFSTNLGPYGATVGPDEFTAKVWLENEPLVEPMLRTGLFEPTKRAFAAGYAVAPV